MHRRRLPRRAALFVGTVTVFVGGLAACGGGDDTVAVESTTSTTTTTPAAEISLDALSDDYCERAEQLSGAGMLQLADDPGRAAASIDALASVAPPGLADDYAVVTDRLDEVGGLDTTNPASALEVLDLLLDAEFLAAFDRVERSTLEECGVRLDAGVDDDGTD